VFQVGLGVLLAIFIYHFPTKVQDQLEGGPTTQAVYTGHLLNWPFLPATIILPAWIFWILTVVVITGSSNAVNLTDGMDGLAAGCMTIVSFAFLALAYVTGDYRWSNLLHFNFVKDTGELAIVCGAMTGACLGFLWYNCNPAQVFMGDTGSLALGGLLAYIAVVIRQELLLLIMSGVFLLEIGSVVLQVGYFKYTRIRTGTGKRIFKTAPLHHHLHLSGWTEQQVVSRFWIVSSILVVIALTLVKLR
jgi:phospho-N-acetylmuramoyl-pentapeptide-transferase